MRSKQVPFFLSTFFLLTYTIAFSQTKEPLRKQLQVTENKHSVIFTYADEIVNEVFVNPPSKKATLDDILTTFTKQTGLRFQTLGTRYIVITRPAEQSRPMLCATILSAETGEPVMGATAQAGPQFVVTNEVGYFQLAGSSDEVVIRSLGFEPLVLSAKDFKAECPPLFMKVRYTTLEEVTVDDVIATGIEEKVDGSVTIRPQVLGILPGLPQPDALQALQYLPSVKSAAEAAADINIRGGTNDQNLVLLDGIKVYQTGHFFGLISGLNPHVISKINLTRNGTSAYFGESTSGTIHMQTQDQLSEKVTGGGGINMLYADGFLSVPLSKKISVQLAARSSLPSSWQTTTYKRYFNRAFSNSEISRPDSAVSNQNFFFFDTHVKLIYEATHRDKISTSFFNVSNRLEYEKEASTREQKKSSLEQQSIGSSINYSRLWSDRVKTTIEGYISGYSLKAINQDIPVNQQLTQGNDVLETGIRLAALVQVKKNFYLQTGYQFFETGITNSDAVNNPAFSRSIKEVNRTHAIFAEGNYSMHEDRTNVRVGVRGNYFSKLNTATFEPRIVFNQRLGRNFSTELLGELKSQTSVQVIDLQSDFLGVEKRRWLLSNGEDVPLLKSRQISTGISFNKNGLLVSADAFYKQVEEILTSSQGFQNQLEFVRTGGAYDIVGLDVLLNKKVKHLNFWFGYSLAESNYQFADLRPSRFANTLDIRHALNGGVSARIRQWEISAGANWHTGRPTTNPVLGNEVVNGTINYEFANSSRLQNYFRVDVSARWHFYYGSKCRSNVGISLWNILDNENVLSQSYEVNSSKEVVAVRQLGLAFTPNIFVRLTFN